MSQALADIKSAFEERGIPTTLYIIDTANNRLMIDAEFLGIVRRYPVWEPLETAFTQSCGTITTFGAK